MNGYSGRRDDSDAWWSLVFTWLMFLAAIIAIYVYTHGATALDGLEPVFKTAVDDNIMAFINAMFGG